MDRSATEDELAFLVEQAEWAWFGGSDPDLFYRGLFTSYAPGELEKMSETDRLAAKTAWKDTTVHIAEALFPQAQDRTRAGVFRSPAEFEKCLNMVTDIAWKARENFRGIQQPERVVRTPRTPLSDMGYLVTVLIELQLYRFDFNYEGIRDVLGRAEDEPLVIGDLDLNSVYLIFARLNAGRAVNPRSIFEAVGVKNSPPQDPATGLTSVPTKIKHLLLHGMWLFPMGYYGWEMLAFAESLLRSNPSDANAHYRRGEAYRRIAATIGLGGHETMYDGAGAGIDAGRNPFEALDSDEGEKDQDYFYRQAVRSLDLAIQNVDAGALDIHNEYKNYRLLVSTEWQVQRALRSTVSAQMERVHEEVAELSKELETQSNQMTWKAVEVLALFVALIGILSMNISVVGISGISMWERFGIVIISAATLAGFYYLVRSAVFRLRVRDKKDRMRQTRPQRFRSRGRNELIVQRLESLEDKLGELSSTNAKLVHALDVPRLDYDSFEVVERDPDGNNG